MSTTHPSVDSSAPVEPARRRRPSGATIAIAAGVLVLAVAIGLAVALVLTTRASAVGAAAAYVPASAPLYTEMRLQPSEEQDAALRELLGRFPPIEGVDLDRPLSGQLGELVDDLLRDEGRTLSWSEDVEPWFDGHVAFAVLDLPDELFDPAVDPMAVPDVPPMLLLVGSRDAEAARAAIDRLMAETDGPPLTETEHAGITIRSGEGADGGAYAVTDDQVLFAPNAASIEMALDARASGDASLAEIEEMEQLLSVLPDDWLAFAAFDFADVMTRSLEAGGPESEAMARLLEHQSMRGAMAVTASGDRLDIDAVSEPPTGPFAVANGERPLAAEVPADSLYYAEGGNLGPALVEVISAIKESAATEPEAADGIRMAEAALGTDLEELVAWVGDGAMSIGWDGSEPYAGMVIVPSDRTSAERRLGQLATFARLASDDRSTGVSVTESTVAGVTVTTIRWQDPTGMGGMIAPGMGFDGISVEYAVTDDRVLLGVGERFVRRALELEPDGALASVARYADAVAALDGDDAAGVGWVDIAGILGAVETSFGLSDLPGYADDIRPWLRPFDRFVSVQRLEDGLLVQRTELFVE